MFDRNKFIIDWYDHFQQPTGYEHEIVIPLEDGNEIKLIARYMAYVKKEDFIFSLLNNEKQTLEQVSGIYDNLRLDERSGTDIELVEVSWRYEGTIHQLQLKMDQRVYILKRFLPFLKIFLKEGYGGPTPQKDIIVLAYPHGFKIMTDWGDGSAAQGQHQRAKLSQRVGIGALKECGWCFGKYDQDGKLQPL